MTPSIEISNGNRVFFPPSSCGVTNWQKLQVKNTSGLPVRVRFHVHRSVTDEVKFDQTDQQLRPFETKDVRISFMPIQRKKYKVKCRVEVFDEGGRFVERESQHIKIFGEGGDGQLRLIPQKIDFKMVKINFLKKEKIFLHNLSNNAIYVVICMNEEIVDEVSKSITTFTSTEVNNTRIRNNPARKDSAREQRVTSNFNSVSRTHLEKGPLVQSGSGEKYITKNSTLQSQFNPHAKDRSLSHIKQRSKAEQGSQLSSQATSKNLLNESRLGGPVSRSQVFEYFSLDFSEGVIPAKSKKEISIIFQPRDICESKLRLEVYSRQIVEEDFLLNQKLSQSFHVESQSLRQRVRPDAEESRNETVNLENVMQSIHRSKVLVNNSVNLRPEYQQSIMDQSIRDDFSITKNDKLYRLGYILKGHAVIKVKAHYPLLKFVNIKNSVFSVSSLWEKFQISRLNKELTKPLSVFEKKNQLNRNTLFDETKDEYVASRKFIWDFGYLHNSKDKRPREVFTEIQNFGGTELEWSIKMESDSEFELSHSPSTKTTSAWRSEKNPHKLFEIAPQNGILSPGGRQQVRLVYHPSLNDETYEKNGEKRIEEEHRMKAYLSIMNGKLVEITLMGRTISSIVGKLVMKTRDIVLPRIPTNLVLPVIIPVVLLNIGANAIKFSLDKAKFFKRNKVSPDIGEIDLENTEGSLSSMEKKNLRIFFKPREERTYKYKATLKVFNFFKEIQSLELTFTGSGWNHSFFSLTRVNLTSDHSESAKKSELQAKIRRARSRLRGQSKNRILSRESPLVMDYDFFRSKDYKKSECIYEDSEIFFSCEELEFLGVRPLQVYNKFVYLCNRKRDREISFKFSNINSILVKHDHFKMEPMEGSLGPGETRKIEFSLTQMGYPSFYEIEIACRITYAAPDSLGDAAPLKTSEISQDVVKEQMFLRIRKASNLDHFTKIFSPEFKKKNYLSIEEEYKDCEVDVVQEILNKSLSETMSTKHINKILRSLMGQPVRFFVSMDEDKDFLDEQRDRRRRLDNRKKLRFQIQSDMTRVDTETGQRIEEIESEHDDAHAVGSILNQDSPDFLFQQMKEFHIDTQDPVELGFAVNQWERDIETCEDFGDLAGDRQWTGLDGLVARYEAERRKEQEAEAEEEKRGPARSESDSQVAEGDAGEDEETDYEVMDADFESEDSQGEDLDEEAEKKDPLREEEAFFGKRKEPSGMESTRHRLVQIHDGNNDMNLFDLESKIFGQLFNSEIMDLLDDCVHKKKTLYYRSKKVKYWMISVIRDRIKKVFTGGEITFRNWISR